jgi:hypothetical protein
MFLVTKWKGSYIHRLHLVADGTSQLNNESMLSKTLPSFSSLIIVQHHLSIPALIVMNNGYAQKSNFEIYDMNENLRFGLFN